MSPQLSLCRVVVDRIITTGGYRGYAHDANAKATIEKAVGIISV